MDAAVGAAGDGQVQIVAPQQRPQRADQLTLDGALLRLDRPAEEGGTVVLQRELRAQTSSR
jgi:hypothetical protein